MTEQSTGVIVSHTLYNLCKLWENYVHSIGLQALSAQTNTIYMYLPTHRQLENLL